VSAPNIHGWTPLHVAAQKGHADVVRLLLRHGADQRAKNNRSQIPYDVADVSLRSLLSDIITPGDIRVAIHRTIHRAPTVPNCLVILRYHYVRGSSNVSSKQVGREHISLEILSDPVVEPVGTLYRTSFHVNTYRDTRKRLAFFLTVRTKDFSTFSEDRIRNERKQAEIAIGIDKSFPKSLDLISYHLALSGKEKNSCSKTFWNWWGGRNRRFVITGLNLEKMQASILRILNAGQTVQDVTHPAMGVHHPSFRHTERRFFDLYQSGDLRWAWCNYNRQHYSCSTIVNEILDAGGLKPSLLYRCSTFSYLIINLAICIAIGFGIFTFVDYIKDRTLDDVVENIKGGISLGIAFFVLAMISIAVFGVSWNILSCCRGIDEPLFLGNTSRCIRPSSVASRATHAGCLGPMYQTRIGSQEITVYECERHEQKTIRDILKQEVFLPSKGTTPIASSIQSKAELETNYGPHFVPVTSKF
jgi:hypothetical protein